MNNGGCAMIIVALAFFVLVNAIAELINSITRLIDMLTKLLFLFGMGAMFIAGIYALLLAIDYLRNIEKGQSLVSRILDYYFPKKKGFDLPLDDDQFGTRKDSPFHEAPKNGHENDIDLEQLSKHRQKVPVMMDEYYDG